MVIFRIFFNLIRLGLRLLWLPLTILSRNLFLVILLVVAVLIWRACDNATPPTQLTPAGVPTTAAPAVTSTPRSSGKQAQVVIEAVTKREDGNSAFATDLYKTMDDAQRAYYSQIYFWAMTNLPSGQGYDWANGNTQGNFTPTDSFSNGRGETCRHFTERLKVRYIEQTMEGIACAKPGGSWCKLKKNATPACGLSGERGFWDSLKDLF